jgi:hypothetical protein
MHRTTRVKIRHRLIASGAFTAVAVCRPGCPRSLLPPSSRARYLPSPRQETHAAGPFVSHLSPLQTAAAPACSHAGFRDASATYRPIRSIGQDTRLVKQDGSLLLRTCRAPGRKPGAEAAEAPAPARHIEGSCPPCEAPIEGSCPPFALPAAEPTPSSPCVAASAGWPACGVGGGACAPTCRQGGQGGG